MVELLSSFFDGRGSNRNECSSRTTSSSPRNTTVFRYIISDRGGFFPVLDTTGFIRSPELRTKGNQSLPM